MNVFVIGGEGFIGSHICRCFVEKGHYVTAFGPKVDTNLLHDLEGRIKKIEGDILDVESLTNGIKQANADTVIHLAAYGAGKDGVAKSAQHSPKKAIDVNIMGFHNVVEASKLMNVSRIIVSSSTTVYGPAQSYKEELVDERSAMDPTTFYGSTKVMNELMIKQYRRGDNTDIIGLRLPLIYGPGRWYKGAGGAIVDMFEKSTSSEKVIIKGGTEQLDLMYVKDVAKVFYEVAHKKEALSASYNVKSHTTSIPELVETLKSMISSYQITFDSQESDTIYPLIDVSKAKKEIGFKPSYTVKEACKDYLQNIEGVILK